MLIWTQYKNLKIRGKIKDKKGMIWQNKEMRQFKKFKERYLQE